MLTELLDPAGATACLEVDARTEAGMADALRAEVTARGSAPRAATLGRVRRMLAPAVAIDAVALAEVCDALVREGDFVLAPGGLLHATPLRAVALPEAMRLVCSLPTSQLAASLGVEIDVAGTRRTCSPTESVPALGGVVVTPEAWCALDRTPRADADFLRGLDARLSSGAETADAGLEWSGWVATEEGMRWRRDATGGQLWRARHERFGWRAVWTAGASPSAVACVRLPADEAARARFVVATTVGRPLPLAIDRHGAVLTLPGWLPRAEHRYLALHGHPVGDGRWSVAPTALDAVAAVLADRLGLDPTEVP